MLKTNPSKTEPGERVGLVIVAERGQIGHALRLLLHEQDELEAAVAEIHAQPPAAGRVPWTVRACHGRYCRRLPVRRAGGVTLFLRTDEIVRVDAANQYVEIHTRDKKYLVRQSMRAIEEFLDPRLFMRIHRSTIVNLERVQELRSVSAVDRWVVLSDSSRHRVSQDRWYDLHRALLELA